MSAPPRLRVLIVTLEPDDARFLSGVLSDHGDDAQIADGVTDALMRLTREPFDLVLLSLAMPNGGGLALVHHLRALYPDVDVVCVASSAEIEQSAHAMALGVLTTVMRPLTGDAVLVAADRARERRMLIRERARLSAEGATSRRRSAMYARCAAFVSETEQDAVATHVLDACAGEVSSLAAAIYVPEDSNALRLVRIAASGQAELLPKALEASEVSAMSPTELIVEDGPRVRILLLGDSAVACVVELLRETDTALGADELESLQVVAALGTAAFAAAKKVELIARGGIKDPETSAYTFAYFGDAAGREIDRAARHGRRFGLLTVAVDGLESARAALDTHGALELRRAVADAILDAVRDSDVLARVEDDEFYLLLPETGLLGALTCRRRIEERLHALREGLRASPSEPLVPVIGVAVYPQDGSDLGRLLRAGRRRSERSRRGVFRKLGLAAMTFWEQLEVLLGSEDESALGRDGAISLHLDLRRAHDEEALVRHAAMTDALVPVIAGELVADAVRQGAAGTVYVAGDPAIGHAVARALEGAERSPLRAWVLGPAAGDDDVAAAYRLPLEDARLARATLVLALTELGGYALVARPLAPATLLAFHAADLDLVEGLLWSLQGTYHLQPELRP
jgi:diguanylate cyclase (GGDEF)-like protein